MPDFYETIPYAGVESLEDYTPGGYHPVTIGDIFESAARNSSHRGPEKIGLWWVVNHQASKR